jgi:hypothetical protein
MWDTEIEMWETEIEMWETEIDVWRVDIEQWDCNPTRLIYKSPMTKTKQ